MKSPEFRGLQLELLKRIKEVKEIIEIGAEPKEFWKGKLNGLQTSLNLLNQNNND